MMMGLLSATGLYAQRVSILSTPSASPAAQWEIQLINQTPEKLSVYLIAEVRSAERSLAKQQSRNLMLRPGINSLRLSDFSGLNLPVQSEGQASSLCVSVHMVESGLLLAENCQEKLPVFAIPPHLVYPYDEAVVEVPQPMFSWTAPAPNAADLNYRIRVVEVHSDRNAMAAMHSAPAYLTQDAIRQQVMPYPTAAPPLAVNQKYAWQIEAFSGQRSIGKTEVWSFVYRPQGEPAAAEDLQGPFVELRRKADPSFYPAKGKICFRFDHPYNEKNFRYEIRNRRNEALELERRAFRKAADNLLILDLPQARGLVEGNYYQFIVYNAKGEDFRLNFQYLQP